MRCTVLNLLDNIICTIQVILVYNIQELAHKHCIIQGVTEKNGQKELYRTLKQIDIKM